MRGVVVLCSSWRQETAVPKETTSTTLQHLTASLQYTPSLPPFTQQRIVGRRRYLLFVALSSVGVSSVFFYLLAIMADASVDVLLKGSSGKSTRGLLRIIILVTIAAAAVSSRLFSVIRMFMTV